MPELPEVETVRCGLLPLLTGQRFIEVRLARDALRFALPRTFCAQLTGSVVNNIRRRGKYLLWEMDSGATLIVHLGMSGSFHFAPTADFVPLKHDHVFFVLSSGVTLAFHDPRRFGMMDITDDPAQHPWLAVLGVEPENLDAECLYTRLHRSRRPIKIALLDQTLIAGIGNIYASEILFRAGIHPTRNSNNLTPEEVALLVKACQQVLRAAVTAGGSSLRDHRAPTGALGTFQQQFMVYGKGGKPCGQCHGQCTVQTITQGVRKSYYCPTKQSYSALRN